MDTTFYLISLISLVVFALIFGVIIIFIMVKIYARFIIKNKNFQFLQNNNIAATLLLISIIFATVLLSSPIISTIQQNLHLAAQMPGDKSSYVLQTAGYGLFQLVISFFVTLIISFIATKVFDLFSKSIQEFTEILEKNNIAVGLLMGTIVISITHLINVPLSILLSYLIPLPKYGIPL